MKKENVTEAVKLDKVLTLVKQDGKIMVALANVILRNDFKTEEEAKKWVKTRDNDFMVSLILAVTTLTNQKNFKTYENKNKEKSNENA